MANNTATRIEAGLSHGLSFGPECCASCDARDWTNPDQSDLDSTIAALSRLACDSRLGEWGMDCAAWANALTALIVE